MGLAVGVWTTVARRPARVETELVGGFALDVIFCDGLRSSHSKDYDRLAKSKRNAAKNDKDTDQSSHDIDKRFQTDHGEVRHEPFSVHSASRLHPAFHRARRIAAFGLWRQQHPDL